MSTVLNMLRLDGIEKTLKGFKLGPIDLNLEAGCVLGLVGPSGAGKTMLLQILMNIMRQDKGNVFVDGKSIHRSDGSWKEKIGYVGNTMPFFEQWSGRKNLQTFGLFYSNWSNNIAEQLAGEFNLDLEAEVEHYSTGQRVKLSIVIAASHQARLIVLDEPDQGLSPLAAELLLDTLKGMNHHNLSSILFATKNVSSISNLADEFALMNSGNILRKIGKQDIAKNWRKIAFHLESNMPTLPATIRLSRSGNEYEALSENKSETLKYLHTVGAKSVTSNVLTPEQVALEIFYSATKID